MLAWGHYEAGIHIASLSFPSVWLFWQGSAEALRSRLRDGKKRKEKVFQAGLVIAVEVVGIIFRDVVLTGVGCFLETIAFECCDSFPGSIKGH